MKTRSYLPSRLDGRLAFALIVGVQESRRARHVDQVELDQAGQPADEVHGGDGRP